MSEPERFRVDEIEYAFIGAALSDTASAATARPLVAARELGHPGHALLWDVLAAQFDAGRPMDLGAARVALREANRLNAVEQSVRLSPLPFMPAQLERVSEWARIIGANARARWVARSLSACLSALQDDALSAEAFAAGCRDAIIAAADEGEDAHESWLDEDMDALQRKLEQAVANGTPAFRLTTGIENLDTLIAGLCPGQVYILAGRTAFGKTALATSVAIGNAMLEHPPSLFASLEMLPEDMAGRALSWLSDVPQSRIRNGTQEPLTSEELESTSRVSRHVRRRIRMLSGDITVRDVRARARRMKHAEGLSLVIVDYLQLVQPETSNKSREREVADISRGLKRLAVELQVPVIALAQLNREADERDTPVLKDLRESGAIEQDATAVIFLWPHKNPDLVRLIVAKSRFGPCGETSARFIRQFTRFENAPEPTLDDGPSEYQQAMQGTLNKKRRSGGRGGRGE